MTLEELRAKLEERGVNVGGWNSAGGKEVTGTPERVQDLLVQLQKVLEARLVSEQEQLDKAKELLGILKHGGSV